MTGNTEPNLTQGLTQEEVTNRLKQYGYNEIPDKRPHPLLLFFSKFYGVSALMLEFIILLSWFLDRKSDVYIVTGLLLFNAIISFVQEQHTAKSIELLKQKLQVNVKLLRNGKWQILAARELVPGDIIRIRIGDFVPADVKLLQDTITVNQSALTGESGDIEKNAGETIYSGSIVSKGEATGVVTLTGSATYFGKTVQLVKIAKPKSHTEKIIGRVVKWLLFIVAFLLTVAFAASLMQGINLLQILPLMLVLLLGAIPVALTAMFTVSMALGSKELAKQGVLVTRLDASDDAASMNILCVDKTGTLTTNKMTVASLLPNGSFTENEVLLSAALASQEADRDVIDTAIINFARQRNILNSSLVQKTFIPFDPKTRRTEALIKKGDEEYRVMKGSFDVIAQICNLSAASIANWETQINKLAQSGYKALAVAETRNSNQPLLTGIVALHDPPRKDSAETINELNSLGVTVKMLTGDALPIAESIARELHIGDKIVKAAEFQTAFKANSKSAIALLEQSNGFAGVYPEDKYDIVKSLQEKGHIVGMTGDGVNDSPALKQAEVGIAVSNATDVAKGAASIVLTKEGLSSVIEPIKIGRMMFERINIWILNKITRTIFKTAFVILAFLILGKYVISASAMLIMIFMTDFVKISLSTDNVKWSKEPAVWNITRLTKIGTVIGLLMLLEAFPLLFIGLNYFNLKADNNALNTFCFEILLFFALFSIAVVREKGHFWESMPGKTLFLLILADFFAGILISTFGILGFKAIPLYQSLFVVAYSGVCSLLLNDFVKVLLLKKWIRN